MVRQAHDRFTETGEPIWERLDPKVEVYDHDILGRQQPLPRPGGGGQVAGGLRRELGSYAMDVER